MLLSFYDVLTDIIMKDLGMHFISLFPSLKINKGQKQYSVRISVGASRFDPSCLELVLRPHDSLKFYSEVQGSARD